MLGLNHIAAVGLLLVGVSVNTLAEEIVMPAPESESTEYSVQLPGRGMTMEMVQNRFGEALSKEPSIGTPPITKWSYKNFIVYFESEFVIHAVVNN